MYIMFYASTEYVQQIMPTGVRDCIRRFDLRNKESSMTNFSALAFSPNTQFILQKRNASESYIQTTRRGEFTAVEKSYKWSHIFKQNQTTRRGEFTAVKSYKCSTEYSRRPGDLSTCSDRLKCVVYFNQAVTVVCRSVPKPVYSFIEGTNRLEIGVLQAASEAIHQRPMRSH